MDFDITVVIPVYNREKEIIQCLESIRTQTWKVNEVIVVDDCSTDGTVDALYSYTGLPLRVIVLKKNSGAQVARNTGILAAKTTWIAFMDSDDIWMSNKIELQMNSIIISDCEAAFSPGVKAWENKKEISWKWNQERDLYSDLISGKAYIPFPTLVVKKDVFDRVGLLDENVKMYQEFDTALMLAKAVNFDYVDEPLFEYRLSDNSISKAKAKKVRKGRLFINNKYYNTVAEDFGNWGLWKWNRRRCGAYLRCDIRRYFCYIKALYYRLKYALE